MSALSINFKGLSVNGEALDTPTISKENRSKIISITSKYLSGLDGTKAYEVGYKDGGFSLKQEGREVALQDRAECKELGRIFKYYQNAGKIQNYIEIHSDERIKEKSLEKIRENLVSGRKPDLRTQSVKGLKVTEGILDQARNFLIAIPTIGLEHPLVAQSGYYAGGLWTLFAGLDIKDGIKGLQEARAIQDNEGKRRSISLIASSIISFIGALSYLTGAITHHYVVQTVSAIAFNVASVLFGIGTLLALTTSFLGTIRCYRFNARINQYLKDDLLSEKEKYKGALNFLKGETSVNSQEREKIVREVNELSLGAEEKSNLIQKKLADLTEVKMKYVKRRTSNKSLHLIQCHVDKILAKIDDPLAQANGIDEAKILLAKIQKESKIKLSLYSLALLASILSLTATLVSLILTGGIATYVIYGLASAIYLGLTTYSAICYLFKEDHQ